MKKKISVLAVVLCILAGIFFITEDTFAAGTKVYETDIFFRENGSDVSGEMKSFHIYSDRENLLPLNKFQRPGFTFVGWNTRPGGKGTAFADGADVRTLATKEKNKDTVYLYAQWKAAGYHITYVMNGGKNAASNPSEISFNKSFTLKKPKRKGYYFAGWYLDKKFKQSIVTISQGTTEDFTLYAKWIKKGKEYQAKSDSAKLKSCKATGDNLISVTGTVRKRLKSSDEYYYLVRVNPIDGAVEEQVGKVYKDKSVHFQIDIGSVTEDRTGAAAGYYAIAVKKGASYQTISEKLPVSNPEKLAENTMAYQAGSTKKGLQSDNISQLTATRSKNAFMNLYISSVVNGSGKRSYYYHGKKYTFCDLSGFEKNVKACNDKGINVTMQINLDWKLGSYHYLIAEEARTKGHTLYAWNTADKNGREGMEAVFSYIMSWLEKDGCHVDNWVLGNEVNSCDVWNYKGNMAKEKFINSYATAYRSLYNIARCCWSETKVFICLDHCWSCADAGYSAKSFMQEFAKDIKAQQKNVNWNLAFHPYCQPLKKAAFWKNSGIQDSVDTAYINMKNIQVLTDFVQKNYGKKTRIILAEQGYTSKAGKDVQAAAFAYAYKIAACNPMIDSCIFRSYDDSDKAEVAQGLTLGIKGKKAYNVYKYMDSMREAKYTDPYLKTIGAASWNAIVRGYKLEYLTENYRNVQ